jgi:uncharacterized protein (TIGR02266 family)
MGAAIAQVLEPYSGLARVPFREECRVEKFGDDREGHLFNLSAQGAFLVADPIPPVGDSFRVKFALPHSSEIAVDAVVMWQNPGGLTTRLPRGCGLRFLALSAQDLERLHTFVKAYTTGFPAAV